MDNLLPTFQAPNECNTGVWSSTNSNSRSSSQKDAQKHTKKEKIAIGGINNSVEEKVTLEETQERTFSIRHTNGRKLKEIPVHRRKARQKKGAASTGVVATTTFFTDDFDECEYDNESEREFEFYEEEEQQKHFYDSKLNLKNVYLKRDDEDQDEEDGTETEMGASSSINSPSSQPAIKIEHNCEISTDVLKHAFQHHRSNQKLNSKLDQNSPCSSSITSLALKSSANDGCGLNKKIQDAKAAEKPRGKIQFINACIFENIVYSYFQMIGKSERKMIMQQIDSGRSLLESKLGLFDSSSTNEMKPILGSQLTLVGFPRIGIEEKEQTEKDWAPRVGPFVKSINDKIPRLVEFRNICKRNKNARIYWIDYDGEFVLRQTLSPGESYVEKTFATHVWLIILGKTKRKTSRNELLCLFNDGENRKSMESILWHPKNQSISCTTYERASTIKNASFETETKNEIQDLSSDISVMIA